MGWFRVLIVSFVLLLSTLANILILEDEVNELSIQSKLLSESDYDGFSVGTELIEEDIDDVWSYWSKVVIDTDSEGNIHAMFKSNYSTIIYATNKGGQWVSEQLDIHTTATGFDFALDSNDNVHISWYGLSEYDLMYTTDSSGEWSTVSVDAADRRGGANSIEVDSMDNIHILYTFEKYNSYYEDTSLHLRYATSSGDGNWQKETIAYPTVRRDTSDDQGGVYVTEINIDSNDKIHGTYEIFSTLNQNGLWYTSGNLGSWDNKRIEVGASESSTAFDSTNQAFISYTNSSGAVKFAFQNEDSSWNKSVVDDQGTFSDTSVVIGADNFPHVTYLDVDNKSLKIASHNHADWSVQGVNVSSDGARYSASSMIGEDGNLHITHHNNSGNPHYTKLTYPDVDSDGIHLLGDACPDEGNSDYDADKDGCIDDNDNDGVFDHLDQCPSVDATGYDNDMDGCIDDSDGDGVTDELDLFPEDSSESVDSDMDGIGDNSDRCEGHDDSIDLDNDGVVDGCDDLLDNDGDGVGNDEDVFPEDPSEANDTDGDGIGDNTDTDMDGDDVLNENDAFPYDALRSKDTDGDGLADYVYGITEGKLLDFEDGSYSGVNMHCSDILAGICMPDYSPFIVSNDSITGQYSLYQQTWASDTGHFSISFSSIGNSSISFQVYIKSTVTERQCMPIYLDGNPIDYGCSMDLFTVSYYDNVTINLTEGNHVLKVYGTVLGEGNKVDNIQLPSYTLSFNEDLDDDNDGYYDEYESSFKETSPCYGDPLDPSINPDKSIEEHLEQQGDRVSTWSAGLEGYCNFYYDQDDDGIVDYYSESTGFVSIDRCPEEFGYPQREEVVNETTGESEFNEEKWGCPLESEDDSKSSSESSSSNTFMFAGIAIFVIVIIVVGVMMRRKGGGPQEIDLAAPATVNQAVAEPGNKPSLPPPPLEIPPPETATGVLNDDGYYWIEWPLASGTWYFRSSSEIAWAKFENK